MSEKVKLPIDVCDALDMLKSRNLPNTEIYRTSSDKGWIAKELTILNLVTLDLLMQALVLGYEPEMTAEHQIKDLYNNLKVNYLYKMTLAEAYRHAIISTLKIHGIHYDWMEDAE